MRAVLHVVLRGNDPALDAEVTEALRAVASAIEDGRPMAAQVPTGQGLIAGLFLVEADLAKPGQE